MPTRFVSLKLLILSGFCLMVATGSTLAVSRQTAEEAPIAGQYSYRYLCYLPPGYQTTPTLRWPLMIFLHGSGETGTNLDWVARNGPPLLIERGRDFPCIVISPQTSVYGWEPAAVDNFIKTVAQKYRVDRDRIYVTGLSMGGYGTWNLGTYDPALCAAIAPLCGGGDASLAYKLRNVPVWAFHGLLDPTVPIAQSQAMINALRAVGGDPLFTIYPNAGHDVWTVTYANEELYTWMFAQSLATPPAIVRSPESIASAVGQHAAFRVKATGSNLSYRWTRNGTQIQGATGPDLFLPSVSSSDEGLYRVEISNSQGTVLSEPATLYVGTETNEPRFTALSVRAIAGQGERTLIMGVMTKESGNWIYPQAIGMDGPRLPVLLRGIGPSLSTLQVHGAMANPEVLLYVNGIERSKNDNWGGDSLIAALGAMKNLQSIKNDSLDAAVFEALRTGSSAVFVRPVQAGGDGVALAECYEVNGSTIENTPRLHALSARASVSPGEGALIAGFIVAGPKPVKVLIRAVGPSLQSQGIVAALADPDLHLYSDGKVIAHNDNWNGDATLTTAFRAAGLSTFAAGSADSALVLTLQPGAYTAVVSSKNNQNGIAMVEVYLLED